MKLVLIRHGKTAANEKHLYCGSTDIGLTENGREELRLKKAEIDYPDPGGMQLITSGMKRCEETLEILFGTTGHRIDGRFREMDLGVFEMHSYDELKERPDYIEWISGDNESNVVPGGESGIIMAGRVLYALDELIAAGQDSVLITHGGVIAAIMSHLFPDEGKNRYEWQPGAGEGYVLEISEQKSYVPLTRRNDRGQIRKMAKIYKGITELIGNTPLVEVTNIEKALGLEATILVKLEYFNPAGSVKDRVAKAMIEDAESKGLLREGSVIIEPTSGNTGIGLAAIAAAKGYRVILTMPETMSVERRNILKAYGAEIVLTQGEKGMRGAIEKAEELAREIPLGFIPGQFVNPANPAAHKASTGPEIWNDTDGKVDIFIAGAGTGGTVTGVGEYLKERNPDVKIVALEPEDSPVLSGGEAGPHKIQGIGAGFVPEVLNTDIYDEVFRAPACGSFEAAKMLAKMEGFSVGISSGAALYGAIQLARRPENKGKTIVALLPDSGDRYYSTALFAD